MSNARESAGKKTRLAVLHAELDACSACSGMTGPPIHGAALDTTVMLIGQAPGPREAQFMRPFAWTAGKTMFQWFETALGVSEERFRDRVYIAAIARCFPGKANGGGDRKPDRDEIAACSTFLKREVRILQPRLVIPVGALAIQHVLDPTAPAPKLVDVVGRALSTTYYGVTCDVIALPHPSGASTWHRGEPGKTLLARALSLLAAHPDMRREVIPRAQRAPR